MLKRYVCLILLLIFFVSLPVFGNGKNTPVPVEDSNNPIVINSWKLIHHYWNILELRYTFNEQGLSENNVGNALLENYKKEMREFKRISELLSNKVVKGISRNNEISIIILSAFYKTRAVYERPAFELVIRAIEDYVKFNKINGKKFKYDRESYFPGYGYADPNYIYRKGLELESEVISTYWQEEEKTMETSKSFEGVVELGIATGLKDKVDGYTELSKPYKINIGGSIKVVVKVKFMVREKIVTTSKIENAVSKIWFELYRAPKDYWITPKWKLCGRTSELRDEPTGVNVTIGAKLAK